MLKRIFLWLFLSVVCYNSYCQTQLEMIKMEAARYKAKDAELNKVYKKLATLLPTTKAKAMLVKAQRAWISYRDAHCQLTESNYEGGSMQPLISLTCKTELTDQRIKAISVLLEDRFPK